MSAFRGSAELARTRSFRLSRFVLGMRNSFAFRTKSYFVLRTYSIFVRSTRPTSVRSTQRVAPIIRSRHAELSFRNPIVANATGLRAYTKAGPFSPGAAVRFADTQLQHSLFEAWGTYSVDHLVGVKLSSPTSSIEVISVLRTGPARQTDAVRQSPHLKDLTPVRPRRTIGRKNRR